ncbi:MAG: hypothetical protein H7Y27_10190, partial [Gemmatimonadaceae bacterium]|nr:hypothetical protein [Chitinophagaceae bacterium]
MTTLELIETLQREMQNAATDIRAEAQVLLALEKGARPEHFMVNCTKMFRREYSRDVVSSEIRDESGWQHSLNIHLSRSGLYDQLPEGLFFQPASRARSSVADLASDYKENKKKESEIRRFFLPFENDFF